MLILKILVTQSFFIHSFTAQESSAKYLTERSSDKRSDGDLNVTKKNQTTITYHTKYLTDGMTTRHMKDEFSSGPEETICMKKNGEVRLVFSCLFHKMTPGSILYI